MLNSVLMPNDFNCVKSHLGLADSTFSTRFYMKIMKR
jgi:hypothetical protein